MNQTGTQTLDPIIQTMRDPVTRYAGLIRSLAGSALRSLTMFGRIVTADFDPKRDTARSVMVVDSVDLSMLRKLAEHGAALGKEYVAAPLVMTPEYILTSLDAFPLELLEILQRHLTIEGDDPFAELTFEDAHMRLQCERELKGILIGLRQGLLNAAGRRKILAAMSQDVGGNLLRTLRGMLWLKGHKEALDAGAALSEMEKISSRKLTGIRAAIDREGEHEWTQFESLYRDVEALGELANAW